MHPRTLLPCAPRPLCSSSFIHPMYLGVGTDFPIERVCNTVRQGRRADDGARLIVISELFRTEAEARARGSNYFLIAGRKNLSYNRDTMKPIDRNGRINCIRRSGFGSSMTQNLTSSADVCTWNISYFVISRMCIFSEP